MITLGSLFSGIGGFELGLERALGCKTIWQVEQDKFCQKVLRKHWPDAQLYDDVVGVGSHNLESVDIICGGFPCQGISQAGKMEGLEDERSGLWWEMYRIISELRPKVAVLENVPNLVTLGLREVLGAFAELGYDAEWTIVSAEQFGAPHLRKRIFIVAYPGSVRSNKTRNKWINSSTNVSSWRNEIQQGRSSQHKTTHTSCKSMETNGMSSGFSSSLPATNNTFYQTGFEYWRTTKAPAAVCRVDDGVPHRLAKLKALGNAIVPQCSEYIGHCIKNAGLLC